MLLAAEAVATEQTRKALDIILEQGVLGAVCVLLIGAVVYLTRSFQRVHADRIKDLKAMAAQRQEDNVALAALTKEVNAATAALSQEVILSNREVVTTMANAKDEVESLSEVIYSLKEQQVRLETALNTKGSRV